jgi:hypothetical protein
MRGSLASELADRDDQAPSLHQHFETWRQLFRDGLDMALDHVHDFATQPSP